MKIRYTGEAGGRYFQRRLKCRSDAAQAEAAKLFAPFIRPNSVVVDFGCGTGGILSNLQCSRRIGVEINEPSVKIAVERGIEFYAELSEIPSEIADVAITHHALEHVEEPLVVLRGLNRILKDGGRIILVVPAETPRRISNRSWRKEPNNNHLYSWTPLTLGNLLVAAGYTVECAFIRQAGFSRWNAWARPIPPLKRLAEYAFAVLFSQFHTICVASKKFSEQESREV